MEHDPMSNRAAAAPAVPASASPRRAAAGWRRRRRRRLARRLAAGSALLLAALAGSALRSVATSQPSSVAGAPESLLGQVMTLVRDRFAAERSPDVYEAAARGLVRELRDPHSQLLSPKEFEDFSRSALGRYAGVGMEIVPVGDSIYVGEVFADGGGAGAGMRRGDRLVGVDGAAVTGMRVDSVVARLRGEPASVVSVEYERRGTPSATARLQRGVVRLPAVPHTMVRRGIGYIPLPAVSGQAGPDFAQALERVLAEGARGLVLDLRGNPGGLVDQAAEVVSAFLPAGQPVVEIRERRRAEIVRTRRSFANLERPVVVLVDETSASAAEIIAGALQDHDRALVVGGLSYGKGLAQSVFPLDGGWALKLTTAKWYTPVGRSIHRDRTPGDSARHDEMPSSVAAGAASFRSLGGRPLSGPGGIVPDVQVRNDSITGAERQLAEELGQSGDSVAAALARVAHRLSIGVDTTFRVTAREREELRRELQRVAVRVDPARWSAAETWVTRLLEQRIASYAFGSVEARRRALPFDRQYLVADSLLRAATSARDLVFRMGRASAQRRSG
jgi:carboxyl-terminal processing protease